MLVIKSFKILFNDCIWFVEGNCIFYPLFWGSQEASRGKKWYMRDKRSPSPWGWSRHVSSRLCGGIRSGASRPPPLPKREAFSWHEHLLQFCDFGLDTSLSPDSPSPTYTLERSSSTELLSLGTTDIVGWTILCGGAVLCIIRCLPASLASTHYKPVASPPPVVTTKNLSQYCQISPDTARSTPS